MMGEGVMPPPPSLLPPFNCCHPFTSPFILGPISHSIFPIPVPICPEIDYLINGSLLSLFCLFFIFITWVLHTSDKILFMVIILFISNSRKKNAARLVRKWCAPSFITFLHMQLLFNKLENEVIQNLLLCPVWNKYMAFFPNTLINFLLRCTPFVNLSSDNFILDKLFWIIC